MTGWAVAVSPRGVSVGGVGGGKVGGGGVGRGRIPHPEANKLAQTGQRAWFAACPGSSHRLNNYSRRPHQRGHLCNSLPRPPPTPFPSFRRPQPGWGAGTVSKGFYIVIYY